MAGDDQGDRIRPAGHPDRPSRAGSSDPSGELAVGDHLAPRYPGQLPPYGLLKAGPQDLVRDPLETATGADPPADILREFPRPGTRPGRRVPVGDLPGRPGPIIGEAEEDDDTSPLNQTDVAPGRPDHRAPQLDPVPFRPGLHPAFLYPASGGG